VRSTSARGAAPDGIRKERDMRYSIFLIRIPSGGDMHEFVLGELERAYKGMPSQPGAIVVGASSAGHTMI